MKQVLVVTMMMVGFLGQSQASSINIECSDAQQRVRLMTGLNGNAVILKSQNQDGSFKEIVFHGQDVSQQAQSVQELEQKNTQSQCTDGIRGISSQRDFLARWKIELRGSGKTQKLNPLLLCRETITNIIPCE